MKGGRIQKLPLLVRWWSTHGFLILPCKATTDFESEENFQYEGKSLSVWLEGIRVDCDLKSSQIQITVCFLFENKTRCFFLLMFQELESLKGNKSIRSFEVVYVDVRSSQSLCHRTINSALFCSHWRKRYLHLSNHHHKWKMYRRSFVEERNSRWGNFVIVTKMKLSFVFHLCLASAGYIVFPCINLNGVILMPF